MVPLRKQPEFSTLSESVSQWPLPAFLHWICWLSLQERCVITRQGEAMSINCSFFFFPGVFLHCSYSFKTSAQPRFTLLWYVPGNKGAIPMLQFPGMRVQSITGRALDKCISYWALLQILERDLVAIFCKWKNHVVWKLWWGWKPWSARRATGVEPWLAGVKLEWSSLTG